MARSTLVINFLGTGSRVLDLHIGPQRQLRHAFTTGGTFDVTDFVTKDELDQNTTWAALVSAGTFSYTFTRGSSAQDTIDFDIGSGLTTSSGALVADLADAAPAAISMSAGAVGTGTQLAREDHTHLLSNGSVTAVKAAAPASGYGLASIIKIAVTAGIAAAADDVTLFNANAPACTIIDAFFVCSAGNSAGRTVTVRTAAAGGGSAISDAFDCASTGIKRNASLTTMASVAANASLYLRRSHDAVAGTLVLLVQNA